jgi:hypothetical protein
MRLPLFAALVAALSPALSAAQAVEDALYLPPLDTSAVRVDSSVRPGTLGNLEADGSPEAKARRGKSPRARVARAFHPVFGGAIARAARKVEVIDSSAATPVPHARRLLLRRGARDSVLFPLPAPPADSARYALVVGELGLSERSENLPRRFVPPKPSEFDPATGTLEPGIRKGYMEGPGLFTHLQARAEWVIWDFRAERIVGRGTASGLATVRGEPTRAQWEELARDLAKSVLRETAFSPW